VSDFSVFTQHSWVCCSVIEDITVYGILGRVFQFSFVHIELHRGFIPVSIILVETRVPENFVWRDCVFFSSCFSCVFLELENIVLRKFFVVLFR
jgi:hypothetical protein